jgi:glutathione S-transferase
MAEEHLYWALVDERWVDDENFDRGPRAFFAFLPAPVRPIAIPLIRRRVRNALHAQGMGRHSRAEIAQLGTRSIEAIADYLGDKPFFMGSEPTGTDATVFAFAAGTLCPIFDSSLRKATERHANLARYVDRMMERYHPEHGRQTPS